MRRVFGLIRPVYQPCQVFSGELLEGLDRLEQVRALLFFVHVLVVDPAQAVAADLVAVVDHLADRLRVTLRSHGDRVDGQRDALLPEQVEDPPHAGAASVLVEGLHAHVANTLQRLGGDHLGEEGLGLLVTVQDVPLAALFVVRGRTRARSWRFRAIAGSGCAAVTDHVAGVVIGHGRSLLRRRPRHGVWKAGGSSPRQRAREPDRPPSVVFGRSHRRGSRPHLVAMSSPREHPGPTGQGELRPEVVSDVEVLDQIRMLRVAPHPRGTRTLPRHPSGSGSVSEREPTCRITQPRQTAC